MSNWSEFFTDVPASDGAIESNNETQNELMYDTSAEDNTEVDENSEIDNSAAQIGTEYEDGDEEDDVDGDPLYDNDEEEDEPNEEEEPTGEEDDDNVSDDNATEDSEEEPYSFRPIVHKILDEDGEVIDVELSEEDIAKAAFDKKYGTVDNLFKVIDQAKPVIDVYTKNPTVKWIVDGLARGYTEEQLLASLYAQRGEQLSQSDILKKQQEELELLESMTPIERELYDMRKRFEALEAEKRQLAQQQQRQFEQQRQRSVHEEIVTHNQQLLIKMQQELGYELKDEDAVYIQGALSKWYPKNVDDPKAGFYNFAERKFNKNQIKGLIKYSLSLKEEAQAKAPKKPQVDAEKAEKLKQASRQAKAPKVLAGNVGVGKNQKSTNPSTYEQKLKKQGYLSASDRMAYQRQELF